MMLAFGVVVTMLLEVEKEVASVGAAPILGVRGGSSTLERRSACMSPSTSDSGLDVDTDVGNEAEDEAQLLASSSSSALSLIHI